MNTIRKRLWAVVLVIVMMLSCSGCAADREKEQMLLREKGIQYLQNGEYEAAVEAFQGALDLSLGEVGEKEIDICFYKAQALYMCGDTQGAMDTYTAVIDYNGSAKAYFLRGNLYYSLDKPEKAIADYKAAIKAEKDNYEIYIGVYEALASHGQIEEANTYLEQALNISGNKAYDKMQKGRIYYLLGDNEEAVKLLNEAIEGKESQAYYYLAEVQFALGNTVEVECNLQAYIASEAADPYNLFEAGYAQLQKGNYDLAVKCFETALALEYVPNKQVVMKHLVLAYENKGDFAKAKEVLAEYITAYPEDEEAAREFIFLETR